MYRYAVIGSPEELLDAPMAEGVLARLCSESSGIAQLTAQARAWLRAARCAGTSELSLLLPCGSAEVYLELVHALRGMKGMRGMKLKLGAYINTPHAACVSSKIAAASDFLLFDAESLTEGLYHIASQRTHNYARFADESTPVGVFDQLGLGTLLLLSMRISRAENKRIEFHMTGLPYRDPDGLRFCEESGFVSVAVPLLTIPHNAAGTKSVAM